jgi:hypothetical protein
MHHFKIYCKHLLNQDNHFSQNLMNSIGVDFKLKNIENAGQKIKLQIVNRF